MGNLSRRGLFGLGFAAAFARALPIPKAPARYDLLADSFSLGPALKVGDMMTFAGNSTPYVVSAQSAIESVGRGLLARLPSHYGVLDVD